MRAGAAKAGLHFIGNADAAGGAPRRVTFDTSKFCAEPDWSRADPNKVAAMPPGPTGLHPYLDNLVRLSKVPAATISAIRGRARAAAFDLPRAQRDFVSLVRGAIGDT